MYALGTSTREHNQNHVASAGLLAPIPVSGRKLNHQHNHHDHTVMVEDFRKRFWLSLVLTLPILLLSPMIQEFFGLSKDCASVETPMCFGRYLPSCFSMVAYLF
jgi:hypothetical protein